MEGSATGDRKAAEHYGYEVTSIQGDMHDLSTLEDGTFDLVYQANSLAYIAEVRPLYEAVSRVLKPGGRYRVCAGQPACVTLVAFGRERLPV